MTTYDVGVRKYVENNKVHHWLLITAKTSDLKGDEPQWEMKSNKPFIAIYLQMINSLYWKIFIILTIFGNICMYITYVWQSPHMVHLTTIIAMHLTCIFYWIDFIGAIIKKKQKIVNRVERPTPYLVCDAISLIPLSALYLMAVRPYKDSMVWGLRTITLIRFYRIPRFFAQISATSTNHWVILTITVACYQVLFIIGMSNLFLISVDDYSPIEIENWNTTTFNRMIVSLYYTVEIMFTVGYGDITPIKYPQILVTIITVFFGCVLTNGVYPGILDTAIVNKGRKREHFRYEYEATKNILKDRKIDPKAMNKVLDNINKLWKFKRGSKDSPNMEILPLSMQKEIRFDINFAFINRSIIFSSQPRWFLRSVTMCMKNFSYLPGDVILEPGTNDKMICVASGVIEVLSEQNDESALISMTNGSVIGEAALFIPLVNRCVIKASTYVELQVLMKVDFTRLALIFPEIFRNMRESVFERLNLKKEPDVKNKETSKAQPYQRRNTKRFLRSLKGLEPDDARKSATTERAIKKLYRMSENIPRVKTYSLTLLREKPYILRPFTSLTKFWERVVVIIVIFVAVAYPVWAGFYRQFNSWIYVLLFLTRAIYVVDIYIECTTAIEQNDHYTYITSVKNIIKYKLKTVGFYLDILSSYYLSILSPIFWPHDTEYGHLLLSLNALLKTWRVVAFMRKQEDDMNNNLLFLVTVKYMLWTAFFITWGGMMLYVEARPSNIYIENRWFQVMEMSDVENNISIPRSSFPGEVAFYFATTTVFAVGYGDLVAASVPDCAVTTICTVLGFALLINWIGETSAVMKHLARIKTEYQEELFAVHRFMVEHNISKVYQHRVNEYFRLQWEYNKGYSLKEITISDVLPSLQSHIITLELAKSFLTVPLFREAGNEFLKLLAKLCKVRVLPPGEVVTGRGSYTREMYILENGYCEIQGEGDEIPQLIGAVNSFGFTEMILGKQQQLQVETVTHARIISLNYSSYLAATTRFPSVKMEIDDMMEKNIRGASEVTLAFDPLVSSENWSSLIIPPHEIISKQFINVYKYHKIVSLKYSEPFAVWGKFRVLQYFLLPITITPTSPFIKYWMIGRIVKGLIISFLAPIQFSFLEDDHIILKLIIVLQILTTISIYLMFHVGYYDKRGLLMFHPAKTATWYLKGSLTIDLISVFPFYWLFLYIYDPQTGTFVYLLMRASGMIMVLHFYKFLQGCHYLEKDILRKTDSIKLVKLFPLVLMVINFLSGLVLLVQCSNKMAGLQGDTRLAQELEKSISFYCGRDKNSNETMSMPRYRLYLTIVYWVTTTVTCNGFGDITPRDQLSMAAAIAMIIFGICLFMYVLASITSSMVNKNVVVSKHRINLLKMLKFMKTKNISPNLQIRLALHYKYNWERTKGANPQIVFSYIHAGLREDIVSRMYESIVMLNPQLKDFKNQFLAIIGKGFHEMYFLRGEIIINENDLGEYLYMIYRGQVLVISDKRKVKMGSGGMFGNISNKTFSLSSDKVIAAENVDLISLNSKAFFSELMSFIDVDDLIVSLTSSEQNYIIPTEQKPPSPSYSNVPVNLNKFLLPESYLVKNSETESDFFNMKWAIFKNSIFYVKKTPFQSFVILPHSLLQNGVDVSLVMLGLLSSNLTLYMFAFQDDSFGVILFSYLIDAAFFIEVYLQFHKTQCDKYGDYLVDSVAIRKRYLRSRTLIYDILTRLPFEVFCFAGPVDWWYKLFTIFRLNRVLRLKYVFDYFHSQQEELMSNKVNLHIGWILVVVSITTNALACIWFVAVCPLGYCQEPTWVTDMDLLGREKWEYYIYSAFHIIIVSATIGLLILPVYSTPEIALTTVFMIIVRYVYVLLTGYQAATINASSLSRNRYMEKVQEFKTTFKRQNISDYQLGKLINYMTKLWSREGGTQIPPFISKAPYAMKCEIMTEMFGTHLSQSYIFSRTQPSFLRQLSSHLIRFVYFPGNYIVQQGDIDNTMYFIHQGEVSVLTIHPELLETMHIKLVEHDSFGMIQGFIVGKAHNFTYRAETEVEMLQLTLKDWQHLLKYFPKDAETINERIESLPADTF